MGLINWTWQWNCWFNSELIEEQAQALKEGFFDLGYDHIIIDDCWQMEKRSSGTFGKRL
jgi:hypothetical protein